MSEPPETLTLTGSLALEFDGLRPLLIRVLHCDQPFSGTEVFGLSELDELVLTRANPGGSERSEQAAERRLELPLPDGRVSRPHARLSRRGRHFYVEDLGSKNGTRVNGRSAACEDLADGDWLEVGRTFFLYRERDAAATGSESDDATSAAALPGLTSLHPELDAAIRTLAQVASSRIPVVLLGETGTGKEVLARALHQASGRAGRFVAINCGAIPRELVEAELFGVRRGAYTGAVEPRVGHVRSAEGGTLFLDEVAELPPHAQVALLRVLETHEVIPVGETRPVSVDFRVVAATNRDLVADVAAGRFRSDLFARLGGLQVTVPPLRERPEDLGILIPALLARHGAADTLRIAVEAGRALLRYSWPLNVRELEKVLQTALALSPGAVELSALPAVLSVDSETESPGDDEQIRARVQVLLSEHQGNVSAVARAMGRDRVQIRRWIRRFGLVSPGPERAE
jgi:transcriptional regulator with PAS, ATPase and Fis domain